MPRNAQTCSPSVTGDGAAELPSPPRTTRLPRPKVRFQSSSPSVLIHIKTSALPSAEVRKILSSQIIGVEAASPGSGKRQRTFSVWLHWIGASVSWLTPSLFGPRHWSQLSADTVPTRINTPSRSVSIFLRIRFCITIWHVTAGISNIIYS